MRHAADRVRIELAVADDSEPARPFRDEHAPVRKKCEAPWMYQNLGDYRHTDVVLLGGNEDERPVSQRS